MQKILFLLIIGLFTFNTAVGQTDSTMLRVAANWKKGEQRQYLHHYTKKKWSNDSLQTVEEQKALISFEVLDSTVNGYLIAYKVDSTLHKNTQLEQSVAAYTKSILDQLVYQFRTNEYGEVLDIEDWEALRDQFTGRIEQLLAAEGEVLSMEKTQMRDMLYSFVSTKEQMESFLFKHVLSLFSSYGYEHIEDESFGYELELPNPYQGATLTAYGEWQLSRDSLGRLHYNAEQVIDEDDGQRFLMDMLYHMIDQMELSPSERIREKRALDIDFHDFYYNIVDDNDLFFDPLTGWVEEGAFKRVLMTVYLDKKLVQEERRHFKRIK